MKFNLIIYNQNTEREEKSRSFAHPFKTPHNKSCTNQDAYTHSFTRSITIKNQQTQHQQILIMIKSYAYLFIYINS